MCNKNIFAVNQAFSVQVKIYILRTYCRILHSKRYNIRMCRRGKFSAYRGIYPNMLLVCMIIATRTTYYLFSVSMF